MDVLSCPYTVSIYSVDYVLPVRIGNNSVGVVYRDGECVMSLLDGYDITNKATLFNPSFDKQRLKYFRNSYDRLRVVRDDEFDDPQNVWTPPMTMGMRIPPKVSMESVPLLQIGAPPLMGHIGSIAWTESSPPSPPSSSTVVPMSSVDSVPSMSSSSPSTVSPMSSVSECSTFPPVPLPHSAAVSLSGWGLQELRQWTNGVFESAFRDKDHFQDIFLKTAHFEQMRMQ